MATIPFDPDSGSVFEHGWQSWSPSTTYRIGDPPLRPTGEFGVVLNWRAGVAHVPGCYQGEGLLAVRPSGSSHVHVFAAAEAHSFVPTIRAQVRGRNLVITADGEVVERVDDGPGGIDGALARWATTFAARVGAPQPRTPPSIWCSWYKYFTEVTTADIEENMAAAAELGLPVDVIQVDDGYQAGYGDWLVDSERFGSTARLVDRIVGSGYRAGIWTAPFTVGAHSRLAREHPEWLVTNPDASPASSGYNWGQDLFCLDVTNPAAAGYLLDVYRTLGQWGVTFHKLDFLYAGAIEGRRAAEVSGVAALRIGLDLIRSAVAGAYILGCGAPILPSVGLVDAMRVSCDTARYFDPADGDLGAPGSRGAMMTGAARAFMQGRFWVNDTDCLLATPDMAHREQWAAHVHRYSGLRGSGDRLVELDAWGLAATRRILAGGHAHPVVPG